MNKVLQVTTYPIENPDHGGKLRCFNLREALKKKFQVKTLSFDMSTEEKVKDLSVELDQNKMANIVDSYLLYDWGINGYLDNAPSLLELINERVQEFNPNIIFIEQCFLWPLINKMITSGIINKESLIVYSSHNIEYKMKKDIYGEKYSGEKLKKHVEHVKCIEYDLAKESDIILAVSEEDKKYLTSLSPNKQVYLYRNGHSEIKINLNSSEWKARFLRSKRNFIYVASWHGPNIEGLYRLIEGGLLDLPSKDVVLWVLGSVGPGIVQEKDLKLANNSSVKILGPVSSEDIDSAILESDGIVLPVWSGGGSNLKTAQALLSGKTIIASSFAFRGFEEFLNEKEVYISEEPSKLVEYMGAIPLCNESIERIEPFNELRWENLLSSLAELVNLHVKEKNENFIL